MAKTKYYSMGYTIHSTYVLKVSPSNYIQSNTRLYRSFNTTWGGNWCALYCALWLHAIITPFIMVHAIIKKVNPIQAVKRYYNGVLDCAWEL